MSTAEIIQIIIGSITLIVTALVPVMIYWLQKRHEKEIDAVRKEQIASELENKANEFLIDHENERDYLPWCTIASGLHRHEHHTRKIYTDFCRCPYDVQKEILKQSGFTLDLIPNDGWVERCIEKIREFIKENDLGEDWLYDNGKFFHRNFELYRDERWERTPYRFKPIRNGVIRDIFNIGEVSFGTYLDEYLYEHTHKSDKKENSLLAPVDYVAIDQDFRGGEENNLCKWVMEIVFSVTVYIHNTTLSMAVDAIRDNLTDAAPETLEDRYYEALFYMYYTFVKKKAPDEE